MYPGKFTNSRKDAETAFTCFVSLWPKRISDYGPVCNRLKPINFGEVFFTSFHAKTIRNRVMVHRS